MSIFGTIGDFVSNIFKPAKELISEAIVDKDLRNQLNTKLAEGEQLIMNKMLEYETKALEESSKVAVAELASDSTFTKLYRPIIISGMFVLLCLDSFGVLTHPLPPLFIQIFGATFGVVSAGRSFEKILRSRNE